MYNWNSRPDKLIRDFAKANGVVHLVSVSKKIEKFASGKVNLINLKSTKKIVNRSCKFVRLEKKKKKKKLITLKNAL